MSIGSSLQRSCVQVAAMTALQAFVANPPISDLGIDASNDLGEFIHHVFCG